MGRPAKIDLRVYGMVVVDTVEFHELQHEITKDRKKTGEKSMVIMYT